MRPRAKEVLARQPPPMLGLGFPWRSSRPNQCASRELHADGPQGECSPQESLPAFSQSGHLAQKCGFLVPPAPGVTGHPSAASHSPHASLTSLTPGPPRPGAGCVRDKPALTRVCKNTVTGYCYYVSGSGVGVEPAGGCRCGVPDGRHHTMAGMA